MGQCGTVCTWVVSTGWKPVVRGLSTGWKPVIRGLSTGWKPVIRGLSTGWKPVVRGLSTGWKPVVRGLSTGWKPVIRGLSTGWKPVVRGLSTGWKPVVRGLSTGWKPVVRGDLSYAGRPPCAKGGVVVALRADPQTSATIFTADSAFWVGGRRCQRAVATPAFHAQHPACPPSAREQ